MHEINRKCVYDFEPLGGEAEQINVGKGQWEMHTLTHTQTHTDKCIYVYVDKHTEYLSTHMRIFVVCLHSQPVEFVCRHFILAERVTS